MAKKQHKHREARPARFPVGTVVRVRAGTTDPDFPDIPLGGWVGTVKEVDMRSGSPLYLIEWNRYTLEHIHPIYRKRCERDGLDMESMALDEASLELDDGSPQVIEQPGEIVSRPLSPDDEDDRVRIALGLTSDDPLDDVDYESLRRYHAYLAKHLSFPFPGTYSHETGPLEDTTEEITVVGLLDDDEIDDMYGLLCQARMGKRRIDVPLGEVKVAEGNCNQQLIEDYSYWFWNYR
jgi:hypothetical protein